MTVSSRSILAELKTSGRLPSPTGVALSILELTRNPDTSTEDMAVVLQGDPSLSGQVLKYANCASSGARTEITSINDGLVRLGTSMVRQLCLGFSVLSNARSGPCPGFNYQRYWTRSLAMAVCCQALSDRIRSIDRDEAFSCGLLGSIGSLALASVYPQEYAEVLRAWNGGPKTELTRLEKMALSIDRHEVTAALFEDWGLPERYAVAARRQDDLDWLKEGDLRDAKDIARSLARLLNVADLAAEICLETGPERHLLVLDFMKISSAFGCSEEQWIQVMDQVQAEWSRMGRVLDILTSSVPPMESLVRRARECRRPIDDHGGAPETRGLLGARPQAPASTDAGLEILVACRDAADTAELAATVAAAGHLPLTAAGGHDALELALANNPQLILGAENLDGLGGLELCRTLRRSAEAGQMTYILLTEDPGVEARIAAFEAGADDCLTQPVDPRLLVARLNAARRLVQLQEQAERDREDVRLTVAELGILNRQLEHMALEDTLTTLPNRRAGLSRFEQDWSRSTRNATPLLCMLLDIDHFKKVNDTWGHDAGDVVLRETALLMKRVMRDSDTVCRFGGEEFLVVCPEADVETAKIIGDRIRQAVQDNRIETREFQGSVTISIGVAVRSVVHESPKDLIKDADEALYAAKDAGRNKVCIAGPD